MRLYVFALALVALRLAEARGGDFVFEADRGSYSVFVKEPETDLRRVPPFIRKLATTIILVDLVFEEEPPVKTAIALAIHEARRHTVRAQQIYAKVVTATVYIGSGEHLPDWKVMKAKETGRVVDVDYFPATRTLSERVLRPDIPRKL